MFVLRLETRQAQVCDVFSVCGEWRRVDRGQQWRTLCLGQRWVQVVYGRGRDLVWGRGGYSLFMEEVET